MSNTIDSLFDTIIDFADKRKITVDQAIAIAQIKAVNDLASSIETIQEELSSIKDATVNNTEVLAYSITDVVAELNRVDRSVAISRNNY